MSPVFFLSVLWQIQCNNFTHALEMFFSSGARYLICCFASYFILALQCDKNSIIEELTPPYLDLESALSLEIINDT